MSTENEWPLWEVFVRTKAGLDHKHCGSLHAADAKMAVQMAREVYTRRQEGCSVWVVPSSQITASCGTTMIQHAARAARSTPSRYAGDRFGYSRSPGATCISR